MYPQPNGKRPASSSAASTRTGGGRCARAIDGASDSANATNDRRDSTFTPTTCAEELAS